MPTALALDVGGTKLAAALVTAEGEVGAAVQAPTPTGPVSGDELFDAVVALLGRTGWREVPEVTVLGVGCGGPMGPDGEEVSPLNIPAWRRFPLRARLRDATGLPTFVDNDAKAFALAEGWLGAAAGRRDYLGMVVSTGVGGGLVSGGRLLDGAGGNAGHIGHVVVEPRGRWCVCGARGCLEAEASGSAIADITGRPAAEAGPDVMARTGGLVGRAVASVINLCDLGLAVVGGSVALGFGRPFFVAAQDEIDRRCRLDFSLGAAIVPAGLGGEAPLVGAGAVAWRGLGADA